MVSRASRYNEISISETTEFIVSETTAPAEDKLYKSQYIGSGTFIISKPKRNKTKMRQTRLKNPRGGSRK